MSLAHIRTLLVNPLDWDTGLRCAVAAMVVAPFTWAYSLVGWWLVTNPTAAPYFDTAFTSQWVLPIQTWVVVPIWLGLGIAGLVGRERWEPNGVLPHLVSQVYFVWFGLCSYAFGPQSSLYPATVMLGGSVYVLALFPYRTALLGISSFVAIVGGTSVASAFGAIPYAPLLRASPFEGGALHLSWLFGVGGVDLLAFVTGIAAISLIIARWHDREEKLAQATALISRYVAAQVARLIASGKGEVISRPDRRRLTLVFADVNDFGAIAEHLEPEELSEMLNLYLSEMTAIAEAHGGMVDKFVGDMIMIIFGAPAAMEEREQGLRAVRMAIAMQARVRDLRTRWLSQGIDHDFRVRIGVNTGVASIGSFGSYGRLTYTAIGRQVNLAARLQVRCEPGEILLGHGTWLLVRDEIACSEKGEVSVKGMHAPVRIYEVASVPVERHIER